MGNEKLMIRASIEWVQYEQGDSEMIGDKNTQGESSYFSLDTESIAMSRHRVRCAPVGTRRPNADNQVDCEVSELASGAWWWPLLTTSGPASRRVCE